MWTPWQQQIIQESKSWIFDFALWNQKQQQKFDHQKVELQYNI